jgi:hypothetical protein
MTVQSLGRSWLSYRSRKRIPWLPATSTLVEFSWDERNGVLERHQYLIFFLDREVVTPGAIKPHQPQARTIASRRVADLRAHRPRPATVVELNVSELNGGMRHLDSRSSSR